MRKLPILSPRNIMTNSQSSVRINLPAKEAWVGLVQAAAEQGGRVFGLDSSKTQRLVHGAEELLLFLTTAGADAVEMSIRPSATSVLLEYSFTLSDMDFSAMNIVSSASEYVEDDWGAMSLLLATRMTDGFKLKLSNRRMSIVLWMDKAYPEPKMLEVSQVRVQGGLSFSNMTDADALYEACSAIVSLYPPHHVPHWCSSPGKMADMIVDGELSALGARDGSGRLCGVIFWHNRSEQSITFYGPYDFSEDQSVRSELVLHFLRALGRSGTKTVFSSIAPEPLAEYGFELLAEVPYILENVDTPVHFAAWERQLGEDFGASIWAHPYYADFLRNKYEELELIRDLREFSELGEAVGKSSVFGVRLEPRLSEVFLHPEFNGSDLGENLERHVKNLSQAGYKNIFLEIDLGTGWHAALGGCLERCGFQPELLLPNGGQSDILIFRNVQS